MDGKRARREAQWRTHVSGWRNSGQSQVAYCAAHGLSVSTLGYWIRQLRQGRTEDAAQTKLTLVAARPMGSTLPTAGAGAEVTLRSPSGWALAFGTLPPTSWLRELLETERAR